MRRFAEISHIELLVLVERYGNVVYYGEKSFHLSYIRTEIQHFEDRIRQKSDFGKREKNAVKVTAPKIAKSP